MSSTGNATIEIVSALAGLRDDPNQIQISAPVQSGSSGGPFLDASGQLIGVVVSKLDAVRGDMPQNVNFAIKASTAAKFLDAHGIAYQNATSEKALAIPDIVEQARGFSVQVLCQGWRRIDGLGSADFLRDFLLTGLFLGGDLLTDWTQRVAANITGMIPGFIEPYLSRHPPSNCPSGPDWVHEIKHDGYRLMARRDPIGIRLLTRNGHDWSPRYPLIVEAVNRLEARSA